MRNFSFPKNNKKEAVNIKIVQAYAGKARTLAVEYDCTISDILQTFIEEGIQEYEIKYGQVNETTATQKYDHRRDLYVAGDGRRHEAFAKQIDDANRQATHLHG